MTPISSLFFKVSFVFISFTFLAKADEPINCLSLMPCPETVTIMQGEYRLSASAAVFIHGMSSKRRRVALSNVTKQLKKIATFTFTDFHVVNTPEHADIEIRINKRESNTIAYQFPTLGVDESYHLIITSSGIKLQANTEFGALHGLATLVQLAALPHTNNDSTKSFDKKYLTLPVSDIIDSPRFKWRGLLLDSVRHFLPVSAIKRQLDGMAAAKLNVFHWHLTDDQGWRIESKKYPRLHQVGADNRYYRQEEIIDIVSYASELGIRVVPEFDVPGHASAIAVAYPALMAEKKNYTMERHWGVFEPLLDISNPTTYQFIDDIVDELTSLFPDSYLHIGGDEVNPKQWQNNRQIKALMLKEGLVNAGDLHHYFNARVEKILAKHQRKMIGWDEILHQGLSKNVVVQSWRGLESINVIASQGYQALLSAGYYIDQPQLTSYHYRNDPFANVAINGKNQKVKISKKANEDWSSWSFTMPRLKGSAVRGKLTVIRDKTADNEEEKLTGYLKLNDHYYKKITLLSSLAEYQNKTLIFSFDSWMGPMRFELKLLKKANLAGQIFVGNSYYPMVVDNHSQQDVQQLNLLPLLSRQQAENILGGEATLWSEMVNEHNVDIRTWPRLFAIAERFWSPITLTDSEHMYQRLTQVDLYGADIIGLRHKAQQRQGLLSLLNVDDEKTVKTLIDFSQAIEPAHYYTRHHIKYQEKKYHQDASLTDFVDYLPVESFALLAMKRQLSAYKQGDKSALKRLKETFITWQNREAQLVATVNRNNKLAGLTQYINDYKRLNIIALSVIAQCEKKHLSVNAVNDRAKELASIQEKQREMVLGAASVIKTLIAICH